MSRTRTKQGPYHWNRDQQDAQDEDPQRNHLVYTEKSKAPQSIEEKNPPLYIQSLLGNPKKQIKWYYRYERATDRCEVTI
jgi:hypothetical protein